MRISVYRGCITGFVLSFRINFYTQIRLFASISLVNSFNEPFLTVEEKIGFPNLIKRKNLTSRCLSHSTKICFMLWYRILGIFLGKISLFCVYEVLFVSPQVVYEINLSSTTSYLL